MAQTLDPEKLELKGEPVALGQNLDEVVNFSASNHGQLVYVTALVAQRQLAWFDLQGKFLGNVGPSQGALDYLRISPDGTRLAATREEPDGRSDIFVLNLARASETRLTSGPAYNANPVWSPDGTQIAFSSNRDGGPNLYVRAADGSGSDRLLLKNADRKWPRDWSPDGKFLLFDVQTPKGSEMWKLDLAASGGEPKASPYLQKGGVQGCFSPDGHYVAYVSHESGVSEVYVRPFAPDAPPADVASVKVSSHGGESPCWRSDGKELLYVTRGSPGNPKIWAADVTLKPSFGASIPRPLGEIPTESVTFMPDAKRALIDMPVGSQKPSIVVVLNWQAALKK
jgi:Tol biopolymer transport system component